MMFHFEDGLMLTRAQLAVDMRRRQPRGFISHAHSDHIARHEYTLCTPETAALVAHRLGRRRFLEMPYRETVEWGGLRLTTYPAGHCLGSAMLLAEDERLGRLLYTGDFKLGPSATAEQAELPRADILVIESTYGDPHYRLPPREEAVAQLIAAAAEAIEAKTTPVVLAYTLGKAQEVTKLLTAAGFPVVQHRDVYAVSMVYRQCGVDLGPIERFDGTAPRGAVLVVPPRVGAPPGVGRCTTIMATGWALAPWMMRQRGVDRAVPLSDHADYDELIEAVRRVGPRQVHCTHGPPEFVERLRDEGFDAYPLGRARQTRMF